VAAHDRTEPIDAHEHDLAPGTFVDHFRVVRLLGQGGMAQVYLARDTRLGRKVALKVIRPDVLGAGEASERFLFEARATARFNHPHIVTIHAVGEHRGRPYVALEYLEGQSLRERIDESRPSVAEALRIGLSIAEALAEAHASQVLHRDLKPENVVIPRDGRLRVVDFGLAQTLSEEDIEAAADSEPSHEALADTALGDTRSGFQSRGGGLRGTPYYMAPEQWTGVACSGATDVWALGVMLYEMVTGRRPYRAPTAITLAVKVCNPDPAPPMSTLTEVRPDLDAVVSRCLEKDPAQRPTAPEVVQTLRDMLHRHPGAAGEEESPFRGLLPFGERHAGFFFGRDAEVEVFLERLRDEPILPVVGPSGAGKSSFVQAGVIPRLREQGKWTVLRLRPGSQPFRTLAARLRTGESTVHDRASPTLPVISEELGASSRPSLEGGDDEQLARELRDSPTRLNLELQRLAERASGHVLLFVDQLEELYTQVQDEAVRRAFMRAVCTAADDRLEPVRVMFTLREDFIGRLAEGDEARDALGHVMVLRSPDSSALEEIVTRPAEAVGYRYDDPKLVSEMVSAVGGEPACLPLLQFVTRTLWDRRDRSGRLLRRAVYDEVGGVAGALAFHADGVLDGMSEEQARLARDLLLMLVTPQGTRRSVVRHEVLQALGGSAEEVLDRLTQSRLVTVRRTGGRGSGGVELELAHESLIRSWKRLARWIDDCQDDLSFLDDITQAAELWDRRGRRAEELWADEAYREARRNLERCARRPGELAQQFLEAARVEDARRRRRKRLRRLAWTVGLSTTTCLALLVALAFARQKAQAVDQREQAIGRWSEAEREAARNALLRGEVLEARARVRRALQLRDTTLGRALWWRLQREPLRWKRRLASAAYDVAFSPDGRTVAVAGQDEVIHLFDTDTLASRELRGHDDQVFSVAFSPDGKRLASGTWSGAVRIWDLETGRFEELEGHTNQVWTLGFSPDGSVLASGSHDTTVRLWDLGHGAKSTVLRDHTGPVGGLAFDARGKTLVTVAYDGTARVWQHPWDRPSRPIVVPMSHDVAISPDGRTIALGGMDRVVRLVNVSSGEVERELRGQGAEVTVVAFSPDGSKLASAGDDGSVRIWDATNGETWSVLPGDRQGIHGLDVSPDGRSLATAASSGTIALWDVRARRRAEGRALEGHRGAVRAAVFAPRGGIVASAGEDGSIRIWDSTRGEVIAVLQGHTDAVTALGFSPSGRRLASGSADRSVLIWRTDTWTQDQVLAGHDGSVNGVTFCGGDTVLVSGAFDATVREWDLAPGTETKRLIGHTHGIQHVACSADAELVASASLDRTVRIWNRSSGVLERSLDGHEAGVWGAAFVPDGRSLVSGGEDGDLRLWDLVTGEARVIGTHPGRVYSVAAHPSGRQVASAGSDGTAWLWEIGSGEHRVLTGHRAEVNSVEYSHDGAFIVTSSDDGTVRLWDAGSGRAVWRAPLVLPREHAAPVLFSHRGTEVLDEEMNRWDPGDRRWARAVSQTARLASVTGDAGVLCLVTHDDALEIWDLGEDDRSTAGSVPCAIQVLATPLGCVTLADGTARFHGLDGSESVLGDGVRAMALEGDEVLAATDQAVSVLGLDGEERASHPVGAGVCAVLRTGEWLVLGFCNGSLELSPLQAGRPRVVTSFERTPSSSVVALAEGPAGTLIAGFANGLVGLWDVATGFQIEQVPLHGAAVHLVVRDGVLHAATDLGDHAVLDLSVLEQPRCDLLRRIWDEVPVLWEGGAPIPTPPPREQECIAGETPF
jgi:WD40 repeat protein/serine/threonine protein kinase